jgi:hypothetical protein
MKLSGVQKLAKWFSSENTFRKMMEESRQWCFTCNCGKEGNIWDIGGIRYKAAGNPARKIKCPYCGHSSMMKIFKA